jgi:hypothetical protein
MLVGGLLFGSADEYPGAVSLDGRGWNGGAVASAAGRSRFGAGELAGPDLSDRVAESPSLISSGPIADVSVPGGGSTGPLFNQR